MSSPAPNSQSHTPAFKLARLIPRILRPRGWRQEKFSEIRLAQTRQRFERAEALFKTYRSEFENDPVTLKAFYECRSRVLSILKHIRFPQRPLCFWRPAAWSSFRRDQSAFSNDAIRLTKEVHELHSLLVRLCPFYVLERMIGLTLLELKSIGTDELYDISRQGLGDYEKHLTLSLAAASALQKNTPPPTRQQEVRASCFILNQENQRQRLSLAQLEIMRDGVTMELFVAAARLIILLAIVLGAVRIYMPDHEISIIALAAILAALGGVVGSVVSAIIRIGKMQDNLNASRAMSLLNGATRSIYYVPFIGGMMAFIVFGFSVASIDLGFIDIHLFSKGENLCNYRCMVEVLIRSFVLGVACGFSERLVHDLVDRFNKKPGEK